MLFSAVQGEVAEDLLHPFPKTADLYEACTHSEVNARADQQDDQNVVCQIAVDSLNELKHGGSSLV